MEASGLCHTDIHAWRGDWPVKPAPPFVPGHEGAGIVEAVGPEVTRVREGDRVAIAWLASACGTCEHCVGGWETLCEQQQNSGYSVDGAYAEYALAMQYAQIAGGRVVAVDLVDEKLKLAEKLGAAYTVNAVEQDPVEAIQDLGGADQAICLAVSPRAFEQAFASLKRGGTLSMVALPADNAMTLPILETVLKGITVKGSIVGTRNDLQEVFDLHAQGRTQVEYATRDLASVNEDFEAVEAGDVPARLVFDFAR